MNIGLVSQNVRPGFTIFRKSLIINLINDGHNVFLFGNSWSKDDMCYFQGIGATPIAITLNRKNPFSFEFFKSWLTLHRLVRHYKIECVLFFFLMPILLGVCFKCFCPNVRIISLVEGLGRSFSFEPNKSHIKRVRAYFIKVILKAARFTSYRLCFLNNDDVMTIFGSRKVAGVKVLGPIGVDLNEYQCTKIPEQNINVLFVGRLIEEKGVLEFLSSAKEFSSDADIRFNILGEYEANDYIQEKIRSMINGDNCNYKNVTFWGQQENVKSFISNCHVLVLPTKYGEGSPRVIQEAMAMGRPIITTRAPGCCDLVENGVNGLIVDMGNVELLTKAIREMVSDRDLLKRFGANSRKKSEFLCDENRFIMQIKDVLIGNLDA